MPLTLEKVFVCALLLAALVPLARWLRSPAWRVGLAMFFGASVASTFAWYDRLEKREQTKAAFRKKAPREGRPGGYVSSETCKACHPDQYASWHHSFHRTMTQYPSLESVRGNFDNITLELNGDAYRLGQRGDEFWVDMVHPDWTYTRILQYYAFSKGQAKEPPQHVINPPRTNLPISLLTGSHHMQAYWVPSIYGNMQFGFPFTYLFEDERWAPRADVFLLPPGDRFTMQVWSANCIGCHATAGQQRQDAKTKVIDTQAAEMGIACEACHGPAEQHVRANLDPKRRYATHMAGKGDETIFHPGHADHVKASEACGQCHAIRQKRNVEQWNEHGLPYQPGGELESVYPLVHYDGKDLASDEKKRALMEGSFWSDGMVRVSGRDFSGMSASACYIKGKLSCLSCHSMHHYASRTNQLIAGMESNRACLQCHSTYAAKLEQHTHHKAGSSGSLCYNCHMPHTAYGLLKAIRSHHIQSPGVKESLDAGRPNACNLCHLDKTLAWTGDKLIEWYGQPIEPVSPEQKTIAAAVLWLLTGDAAQRALIAWHMGWQPAKEVSGQDWMAPHLAQLLLDPYSVVRFISKRSLKRLPGFHAFAYDYVAPPAERATAKAKALSIWEQQAKSAAGAPGEVLLEPDGKLKKAEVNRLLLQRNDRRMELLE
jgi:hypothetical protein